MPDPPTRTAAIALGSNLASPWGDREATLREAIHRLGQLGQVFAVSSFYDTAPVGYTNQPRFLNAAVLLESALTPVDLMRELLAIERSMGRDRAAAPPKGPRRIDLDLLLIGDAVIADPRGPDNLPALTLPHPAMAQRRFVLEPLAEIAPGMVDPRSGLTVRELLARLHDSDQG
jgi:2-amino-4-hydroxy-6-hydroxymethyldihydropteridine diphosphokinase